MKTNILKKNKGKDADLVVFDDDINVSNVYVGGMKRF